ncbi:hypothetical protein PybrP1_008200 [[Pythium] brassicae (nom. inval.)]|nr:hypothetical protein PybrP1_008200 [[Pythium] brassicae (nom. inval.)]
MAKSAKTTTTAAAASGGKKRSRDHSATTAQTKKAPVAKEPSSDSESESEEEDSDDDSETENALFRPAPVSHVEDESDDGSEEEASSASSSASDNEEKEAEEEEEPVQAAAAPAKKKTAKKSIPATSDDNAAIAKEMESKTEATVYVEGIPYQADEGDVVSHFSVCGIVKEVRMPRYQDSGRPRGYAHVVFESEQAIAKALALDGKYLFKRYLSVRRAQTPRTLELALKETQSVKKAVMGCKTVFIKQLPYDVEEQTVRDALAGCGTITSVRLPLWNHTKQLKGFGYVEFAKEDEAVAAVRRSGMKLGGRMVIINLDVAGAPKASFRQADGRYWSKTEEAKKSLAKKLTDKFKRSKAGAAGGGAGVIKKRKIA